MSCEFARTEVNEDTGARGNCLKRTRTLHSSSPNMCKYEVFKSGMWNVHIFFNKKYFEDSLNQNNIYINSVFAWTFFKCPCADPLLVELNLFLKNYFQMLTTSSWILLTSVWSHQKVLGTRQPIRHLLALVCAVIKSHPIFVVICYYGLCSLRTRCWANVKPDGDWL